jgi:hypothetical protein
MLLLRTRPVVSRCASDAGVSAVITDVIAEMILGMLGLGCCCAEDGNAADAVDVDVVVVVDVGVVVDA